MSRKSLIGVWNDAVVPDPMLDAKTLCAGPGWPVDLDSRWCRCGYCFAFGVCIHLVYALQMTEHVDSRGKNVLVDRNKRKRQEPEVGSQAGRPRLVGPVLTFYKTSAK
ncbi:hypothetical protein GQ600_5252 [Phytophthora cactorum]|nr:hypothetical protein GQ600_5252 [Phytophthora cactorum]